MKRIFPLLIFFVSIIVLLIVAVILVKSFTPSTYINLNQAAVVKQMKSLSRLETAQFTIEKIIDAGTNGNTFQQFLFGDKLLLIAHGEVVAGFDLSTITQKDITIQGKSVTLRMPAPQILTTTLDNSLTRVYNRQTGLLTHGDPNLESQARLAAQNSIQSAACQGGILDQANKNGRKQITAMLYAFGFTTVTVEIPSGNCK